MLLDSVFRNASYAKVGVISGVGFLVLYFAIRANEERRIRRLGHHAAKRYSNVPLSLDILYEAIDAVRKHQVVEWWWQLFHNYGNKVNPYTVEMGVGKGRIVLTADPENIKAILATQFQDYGKGQKFNKEWHEFLGDSIFTTDGEKWHDSRQLIRPQFIKDRLGDIRVFEKHVGVLLPMLGSSGEAIDVAALFFRYTLDAATDFLLGRSVDSLIHEQACFAKAFNKVQRIQSLIQRFGLFQWVVPRGEFRKELKVLNQFVNSFVDDALRLSPAELEKTAKSDDGYTFLHAIASYTRDRSLLRDQLVAVLLAGRDTTACTLSWTFYELSNHPNVVQKLRSEILLQVGPTKPPTYADLMSMRYLKHVMSEVLRLYPIVPFNMRVALRDTTIPYGGGPDGSQPVGILKGTPIAYSTIVMQRREDLYPPRSSGFPPISEFVPERWDSWVPKSWCYIPFNGGPRICVGQQFALTEIAYTITRILQRYDRIECRMEKAPKMQSDIVLQPFGGVKVAFHKAEPENEVA